jgi:hypothetical protein
MVLHALLLISGIIAPAWAHDYPSWARDLGLWVQADAHAPGDAQAQAMATAIRALDPSLLLNEDQMLHVRRCQNGRRQGAPAAEQFYTQCHCAAALRAPPISCGPIVYSMLRGRFNLSESAAQRPLVRDYHSELGTLVVIPSRLRRAAHMSTEARVIEDCRGRHLQILATDLVNGSIPPEYLQRLRRSMDQASLSLTTRVIGGPRNPQAPALASVCSLGSRPPTTSRGIFEIDRQGNLLYSPGTDRIARAGYWTAPLQLDT